jgi:sugar-specific transcriptional regulator TrmB
MDTDALLETLRNAGLSPYQADAYVTLLELGNVSAQELAKASDVPGPRIYDVLEGLEEKGYVVTYERDQLYAEAIDPEEGLSGLVDRIDRFQAAVSEIETRWERPQDAAIDIGVVKQFQTVLGRTRDSIIAAEQQILLAVTPRQYLELQSALRSAYQRGVSVQVALHSSTEFTPDEELFEGVCTEVRFGETPCLYEPFLAIVDGNTVCFAPFSRVDATTSSRGTANKSRDSGGERELRYGVLVNDPVNAYVFEWYFIAALWEPSRQVYATRSETPPIEFVDVREVIRAVDPLLRADAEVTVTVEGRRVSTGRQQTVTGRVSSVRSDSSESPAGAPMQSLLTREATIVVDTDDGSVTVGGKGAVHEDVEAARIVITDIVES